MRRFHADDLVLEPAHEIALDKTATVQDLEDELKKMTGLSDIVMAKPFPYQIQSVKSLYSKVRWGLGGRGVCNKELGTRKGLMWRDGTIIVYKEKKKKGRKLVECRKWNKLNGKTVAMFRDEVKDVLTWLGESDGVSRDKMETTLMKPWEFRARKLSNRNWKKGDLDWDSIKRNEEIVLVWRDSREEMKLDEKEEEENGISVLSKGRRHHGADLGLKIYTPAEIAEMNRKLKN